MKIVHAIFELLWNLLKMTAAVLWALIVLIAKFAKLVWEVFCSIELFSGFTGRIKMIFEDIGAMCDMIFFKVPYEEAYEIFAGLTALLDRSSKARAYFFSVIGTVLFFYFFPPDTWGPWHLYQRGKASYYGPGFYFRKTSSGERMMPFKYTAAHRTLPLGITVLVKNMKNGRKIYVRVNDRGPLDEDRIIDLSRAAAKEIGIVEKGSAEVEVFTRKKYGH